MFFVRNAENLVNNLVNRECTSITPYFYLLLQQKTREKRSSLVLHSLHWWEMMALPCQMISMNFMFIRYCIFSAAFLPADLCFSLNKLLSLHYLLFLCFFFSFPKLEECKEQIKSRFNILQIPTHMIGFWYILLL